MTKEIKYRKPPIVEVVCEFRFVPGDPWDAAIPGLVYTKLDTVFPKRRMLHGLQGELSPSEGGLRQHLQVTERAQFLQEDEKAFAQVGPHFLAINHLAPYPSWESFHPLIQQALNAYREVAKPAGLQRIGLRYINRIVFPDKSIKFEDYLNFYPFIAPELPQDVQNFVSGIESSFDGRDVLRLQLLSADPDESGRVTALLDLDYFLARSQDVGLDETLDWVNKAHDRILEIFEACLTPRLRPLFEPLES